MIRRGDIYYVTKFATTGCEQESGRPAIIVSNDNNNTFSKTVEIVFLTSQHKGPLPTHVAVRSSQRTSTALCEQVNTVSVERLGDCCGHCTEEEMQEIDKALMVSLALDIPYDKYIVRNDDKPQFNDYEDDQEDEVDDEEEYDDNEYVTQEEYDELQREFDSMRDQVVKLIAERDVYKELYGNMLAMLTGGSKFNS